MKLTKANISKLELPPGKTEHWEWDDDIPYFGIRLRSRSKVLYSAYLIGSKQRRLKHASASALTDVGFGEARKKAAQVYAQVMLGQDPAGQKIESRARAAETTEPAIRRFLTWQKEKKKRPLKPRSYEEVERHLLKHAKPLHGLQLAKIDRRTVATLTGGLVTSSGPRASDAVRASLSTFFSWAMSEGLVDVNPVVGTNRAHDNQARDRVLSDSELVMIWNALLQDDYGDIVRLLLLLGQRRDEIGSLYWSEVDLDAATITLPPPRTKNRRKHIIALAEPALAILRARFENGQRGDLVFGRGKGGFSGWSKSKQALDQRIVESHGKPMIWRLHDLRRTMSTTMHDRLGLRRTSSRLCSITSADIRPA